MLIIFSNEIKLVRIESTLMGKILIRNNLDYWRSCPKSARWGSTEARAKNYD